MHLDGAKYLVLFCDHKRKMTSFLNTSSELPKLCWHPETGRSWKTALVFYNQIKAQLTAGALTSDTKICVAVHMCLCVLVCRGVPVRTLVLASRWVQLQPCRCYRWSLSSPRRWTLAWTAAEDRAEHEEEQKTTHDVSWYLWPLLKAAGTTLSHGRGSSLGVEFTSSKSAMISLRRRRHSSPSLLTSDSV